MIFNFCKKYFYICSIVVFILFANGCASTPGGSLPVAVRQDVILKDFCVRYGINCVLDSVSQVIRLKKDSAEARTMVGSNTVVVDRDKITLSSPVRIKHGVVYVPYDFKTKIINPLFGKSVSFARYFRKIMIDAGHGGRDPGGIGRSGVHEKDIVLDIAKRFRKNLIEKGIEVVLTRETDIFLTLDERARLANTECVDLFISIHANIAKSRSPYGVEIFYLRLLDARNKKAVCCRKKNKALFDNFVMKKNDKNLKDIIMDMMYVHKQKESVSISEYLARGVSKFVGTRNRGEKPAGFYVLKNTLVPAILIEVGFLSNRAEEKKLKTSKYRQKIADGIMQGLIQYVN